MGGATLAGGDFEITLGSDLATVYITYRNIGLNLIPVGSGFRLLLVLVLLAVTGSPATLDNVIPLVFRSPSN